MAIEAAPGWTLPEALRQLADCGEREIVAEVLSLFQSDTETRLQALRRCVESGDRACVRAQAHSLKGSAVQVGAMAMAEACREMELSADVCPDLATLLEEIESRFAAVSKVIAFDF